MTRKASKSHSAVERLIEQRRQYKDWLARIDADAATAAPSHVADRVREDYAARLDAVTKELQGHEEGVRQALVETAARVEELVQERQARTDELSEARLRHQVGEFTEDRFDEVQTRCKAALNDLTKEIASTERDIERLEEVLAMIQGKSEIEEMVPPVRPAPAPSAGPIPPAPEPVAAAPAPAPVASVPAGVPKPPRPSQVNVDELEFLRSVTTAPMSPTTSQPAAQAPAPPPAKAPELPPLPKAVVPPPPPPPPPLPPPPPPPAPSLPEPAKAAKARRPSEDARQADLEAKTLKCAECGTMNSPSEWYCEKCGAELSTF